MTNKEKAVWLKAIQMDLETIRGAISNIYAQLAIINTALGELNDHVKQLESA